MHKVCNMINSLILSVKYDLFLGSLGLPGVKTKILASAEPRCLYQLEEKDYHFYPDLLKSIIFKFM